jgi:hypothetical protein
VHLAGTTVVRSVVKLVELQVDSMVYLMAATMGRHLVESRESS